ncbi:uncharacterized protein [Bemisia tabaci]|uniref:uncharacterized protein isoform X3 n=1 Tax=Bemisia tabaci TaxID=7038 RepID=UPI003B289288
MLSCSFSESPGLRPGHLQSRINASRDRVHFVVATQETGLRNILSSCKTSKPLIHWTPRRSRMLPLSMPPRALPKILTVAILLTLAVGTSGSGSYTIMKGDTMWKIAERLRINLKALIAANPQIPNPDKIWPGQKINIPDPGQPVPGPAPTGPGGYPTGRGNEVGGAPIQFPNSYPAAPPSAGAPRYGGGAPPPGPPNYGAPQGPAVGAPNYGGGAPHSPAPGAPNYGAPQGPAPGAPNYGGGAPQGPAPGAPNYEVPQGPAPGAPTYGGGAPQQFPAPSYGGGFPQQGPSAGAPNYGGGAPPKGPSPGATPYGGGAPQQDPRPAAPAYGAGPPKQPTWLSAAGAPPPPSCPPCSCAAPYSVGGGYSKG